MRRLGRCVCWIVVAPLGVLALIASASLFLLGALGAIVCDSFRRGTDCVRRR